MRPIGIYLHIPFCRSKCPYCDFYSLPAQEELMQAYTTALCHAIRTAPPSAGERVDTIYFGGGTPILLGDERVGRILQAVRDRFEFLGGEVTLEANPHSTLYPILCGLREVGINRISFGFQSAVPGQLQLLGRTHSALEAARALEDARRAGFQNLSLDIMLGLPGQTSQELEETLSFCGVLDPEHLSAYILKVEPTTPFASRYTPADLDEDLQADLYLQTVERLEGLGYHQYEISNFARPGFESAHNLKYWRGEHYLGVGPAASSHLPCGGAVERFTFPRNLNDFLQAQDPWLLTQTEGEGGGYEEYVMLRLRLNEGLDLSEAHRRFPQVDWSAIVGRAQPLREKGLLRPDAGLLSLTPKGMLLSNSVIIHLLS